MRTFHPPFTRAPPRPSQWEPLLRFAAGGGGDASSYSSQAEVQLAEVNGHLSSFTVSATYRGKWNAKYLRSGLVHDWASVILLRTHGGNALFSGLSLLFTIVCVVPTQRTSQES